MKLIGYELKKIYRNKWFLCLLFIFIFLDIFKIYLDYSNSRFGDAQQKTKREAYENLYHDLKGGITKDKLQFVIDENERIEQIFMKRNYSTEYDENTYTGYLAGDYSMFHYQLYEPLKRLYSYHFESAKIAEKASENITLYQELGNHYQVKVNKKIFEHFANRNINEYYDLTGIEYCITYDFSVILIIILLLFIVIPVIVNENEIGMNVIIDTTYIGRKCMKTVKIFSIVFSVLCIVVLFTILEFCLCWLLYGFEGLGMPIYALNGYGNTNLNCTVGVFILITQSLKLLGCMIIALLIAFVSRKSLKSLSAFVKSFLLILAIVLGYYNGLKYIDPITLFYNKTLFGQCNYIRCINIPIERALAIISMQVLMLLFVVWRMAAERRKTDA